MRTWLSCTESPTHAHTGSHSAYTWEHMHGACIRPHMFIGYMQVITWNYIYGEYTGPHMVSHGTTHMGSYIGSQNYNMFSYGTTTWIELSNVTYMI